MGKDLEKEEEEGNKMRANRTNKTKQNKNCVTMTTTRKKQRIGLYSDCSRFSLHIQTNDWHPNPLNTVQISN